MDKKKHHYIPRHYLKGFTRSPGSKQIWVYEKSKPKFFRSNIGDIGHENHYYSVLTPNNTKDSNTVEDWLANSIEGPASPVIDKIRSGSSITDDEKLTLAVYLNIMAYRVPHHRKAMEKISPDVLARYENEIESGQDSLLAGAKNKSLALETVKNFKSRLPDHLFMPRISERIVACVHAMNWRYYTYSNTDIGFLTTDNPFVFDEGLGIANPIAEISFPISTNTVLVASWNTGLDNCFIPCDAQLVDRVNERGVRMASNYIYYSSNTNWVSNLINKVVAGN